MQIIVIEKREEAHSGDRLTLDASPVLPRNDPPRRPDGGRRTDKIRLTRLSIP